MFSVYDRLYRKARRYREDAAEQVFAFCRALESLLRDRYDVDVRAIEGLVVDLYDPMLDWRENVGIVKRVLSLGSNWEEYDPEYDLWIQIRQLEEYLEYAEPSERTALERELRALRAKLERLSRQRSRTVARATRRRSSEVQLTTRFTLKELKLRDYQEEALERWMKKKRGVIVLPTGVGKTYVALGAIKRLKCRTLVVVPTVALLRQWKERLEEYVAPAAGVYYAGTKKLRYYTVTTYQSLSRRPELAERFDLVILDECHHLAAEQYSKILRYLPRMVMGLTATPHRFDGREHVFLRSLGGIAYRASYEKLRDWLAPLRVIPIIVALTRSEAARYAKLRAALSRIASLAAEEDDDEARETHLRAMLSTLSRLKQLLSEAPSKLERAADVLEGLSSERVLVFSESVMSIEKLRELLEARGVRAATFHYRNRDMSILRRWGRDYNILLSCRALEEGLDVPECSVGLVLSGGLSPRQIIQRVGRLLRPAEGKEARLYVMVAQGTYETRLLSKIMSIARQLAR